MGWVNGRFQWTIQERDALPITQGWLVTTIITARESGKYNIAVCLHKEENSSGGISQATGDRASPVGIMSYQSVHFIQVFFRSQAAQRQINDCEIWPQICTLTEGLILI